MTRSDEQREPKVVDQLFDQFVSGYAAGDGVDVRRLLAAVRGIDRDELEDRIETYIAEVGRRPFRPDAFGRSRLARLVNRAALPKRSGRDEHV